MGFRDWFRKRTASRVESRIEFIHEQDGENERRLKAQLLPLLVEAPHIQRAYLARAGFQPADATSVVLCLISTTGADESLIQRLGELFPKIVPPNVFLDIAFLTDAQEEDVARVCPPFYRRAS